MVIVVSYEWNIAYANRILAESFYAAAPEDIERELKFIQEEIEKGTPPDGPLMERSYVIPDGMSPDEADRLWVAIAPLVSLGCDREEMASISENLTCLLTKEVMIGNVSVTIDYRNLRIIRDEKTGEVVVELPLLYNGSLALVEYNTTGAERLHKAYNVTEFRSYRVVKRAEGFYRVTYMDLESHVNYSVVTRLSLGVYPGYSLAENGSGSFRPGDFNLLMPDLSQVLIAVPGHYEEVRKLVPAQERKVRVLFPAYDPVVAHGWFIETRASSTALSVGDVLTIEYDAEAVNIDPDEEPLSCTITLNGCDAFRPLDGLTANLDNDNTCGAFRLEALVPGTYNVTLTVEGNAAFCIDPTNQEGGMRRTYTFTVSSPGSPMISVSLTCPSASLKHAAVEVGLHNEGGGDAYNATLSLTGQIDAQQAYVGALQPSSSWSRNFTLHLRSATASVRARAIYYDGEGNLYISEAYLTVVSPNYIVPEHFEEYLVTIPEHEETEMVFVPGYEGYTHVRLFSAESSMYVTYNFSGQLISWGYGFTGPVLHAEADRGVELEVQTRFFPISTEGFELDISGGARELNLRALGHMGLPKWYSEPTVPLKYVVLDISPHFELDVTAEESRARRLIGLDGFGPIDRSQVPEGFEVELISEVISKVPVWLEDEEYEALQDLGWPRSGKSYLEDAHETRWSFKRTGNEAGAGASISLIYYPLKRYTGDLVKSLALRNYANQDISYKVRVVRPLLEQGVYISSGVKAVDVQELLVSRLSVNPFSVVQFESKVGIVRVELLKDGVLVSSVELDMSAEVSRFWSEFWRGFWKGFSTSLPGIAMGLMVQGAVIAVLMMIGPGHALAAYVVASTPIVLAGLLQAMRLAPKLQAYISEFRPAYESMRDVLRNQSRVYRAGNLMTLAAAAEEQASWIESYVNRMGVDLVFEDVLSLGFNLTDLLCALGILEASAEQKGESVGRLAGEALRIAVFIGTIAVINGIASASSRVEGLTFESFAEYVKRGLSSYISPPIMDAIFVAKGLWKRLSNLGFLLVWRDIDDNLRELADSWKEDPSKLEEIGAVGANAADLGLEEESTMKLLDVLSRYLKYVGGEGIQEEEVCADLLYNLKLARHQSPELARKLIAWLDELPSRYATLNPMRSGVELLGGEDDISRIAYAWNKLPEGSFENLLKAMEMAVEVESERGNEILSRIRDSVDSGDGGRLKFTSDVLGLAQKARSLVDASAKVSILDSALNIEEYWVELLSLVSEVEEAEARAKLESDLQKVSSIVGQILSDLSKGEEVAAALKRLNRFEEHLRKVEVEHVGSLVEVWMLSFKYEGSVVSPVNRYGDNFRADVPMEAKYMLAGKENFVIPVWPGEGTRTSIVNIPLEVVNYLKIREDDYEVFLESSYGLEVAIPVVVKEDNRIYLTDWFRRAFWDTSYVSDEGRIDWDALSKDKRNFRYMVAGTVSYEEDMVPLGMTDRIRSIAQRLKPLLEEDGGCEFEWGIQTLTEIGMGRVYDEEELPAMLRSWDLYDHYAHSEIDWDRDWNDKNPIYIDSIGVYSDHVIVYLRREFSFNFLVYKYYCLYMVLPGVMFSSRENRIKAAKFIPAAMKDLEVFFKFLNDSLKKYNITSSELVWDDLVHPSNITFGLQLSFKTSDMTEDEVVDATMKRVKALAEYRKKFRGWLPSEERKSYYEITRRSRRKHWWLQRLCAWPLNMPSWNDYYKKILSREMRRFIQTYLEAQERYKLAKSYRSPVLSEYLRFYNLDGYGLRLSGSARLEDGKLKVDDGEIVVDRKVRLRPFPPERISFLRDEYPELFK